MDPRLCAGLSGDQVEAVARMLDALEAVVGGTRLNSALRIECRSALDRGRAAFDPPRVTSSPSRDRMRGKEEP